MEKLLVVEDLQTHFLTRRGVAKAVDGVTFSLDRGETLGLVGESGCGKSTVCHSLLRLVPQPAGKIAGGRVFLEGEDILQKSEREMRKIRGGKIAMIPQDPMSSLNPVFSVGDQLSETLHSHQKLTGTGLVGKAREMLELVGIPSPGERLRNFPHQFSGGMRQRVVGAIALACQPRVLIADEATTNLDVTIQAQYLSLLKEMRESLDAGLIVVTHDFGIVERMCDRVAVMYAGKIVEEGTMRQIFDAPRHPYTVALMKSVPRVEEKVDRLAGIEGQPPSLYDLPPGCSFYPRCPVRMEQCRVTPPLFMVDDGQWASCWHHKSETAR